MRKYRTVEFQLSQEGVPWESIDPVLSCYVFGDYDNMLAEANTVARDLADKYNREVRWSFEDSAQGHYVFPKERVG